MQNELKKSRSKNTTGLHYITYALQKLSTSTNNEIGGSLRVTVFTIADVQQLSFVWILYLFQKESLVSLFLIGTQHFKTNGKIPTRA